MDDHVLRLVRAREPVEHVDAVAILLQMPEVQAAEAVNGAIEVRYGGDEAQAAQILQRLVAGGVVVSSFSHVDGGLEDAFLKATSEDIQ